MFGLVLVVAGGGALSLLWAAVDQTNAKSILAGLGDAIGFMILFVAIPVVLAVLGVLLTLMFRQAILIFLLMISPVAFALYCLPNTEKYFKKWWDLLIKTLVVYPVIVILFCMAQVMAIIFGSGYIDGDSFLAKILAMIAIGIPLSLIPLRLGSLVELSVTYLELLRILVIRLVRWPKVIRITLIAEVI